MDAVAARARAGNTTIYRRWSGKALVMHAVRAHVAGQSFTHISTGDLRDDLPCYRPLSLEKRRYGRRRAGPLG